MKRKRQWTLEYGWLLFVSSLAMIEFRDEKKLFREVFCNKKVKGTILIKKNGSWENFTCLQYFRKKSQTRS